MHCLSNFTHQLKYFYLSSYYHTERVPGFFIVNALYKFPTYVQYVFTDAICLHPLITIAAC